MEFRELKSLSVLAESGSLSETARMVHLSPAAIHKQLRRLEVELEIPLYERREGRLRLTPAADLLLPYLRDMLGQYESALSALEEWKGVRRGLIRIGAGPSLASYVLPRILRDYHERFPRVDMDVQTGNTQQLIDSLCAGNLDLALVVAPETMEEPSVEVVMERETELALVTGCPDAPRTGSLKTFERRPFILFRKGSRIEALIERYWTRHGLSPNVVMRFDSAEALKSMLMQGVGTSMLPMYTVEDDLRAGRLKRIRQKQPPLMMRIHMLARKGGYLPPAVGEFVRAAKGSM